MKKKISFSELLSQGLDIYVPSISVFCFILTFHAGSVKVLLSKFKDGEKWMLASGFLEKEEELENAAKRILETHTGIDNANLRQFYFFGKDRGLKIEDYKEILRLLNADEEKGEWYLNRFVTLGYYSLVKYEDIELDPSEYLDVEWFDIRNIPPLYADYREIIETSIHVICRQIGLLAIGNELLPEKFTLPELRAIYEDLIGEKIDRRNFQRKMLSIGYIKPLNEVRKVGAHKSPNLYSFDTEKYNDEERDRIQLTNHLF